MKNSLELTEYWLQKIVIGLNLCPFAKGPYEQDLVRITACEDEDESTLLAFFFDELEHMNNTSEEELSTSLLVLSNGTKEFQEFYDFVGELEGMLEETGLNEHFQLVAFHPQFKFENLANDDIENYVNRAPYPTLQIIRNEELNALNLFSEKGEAISFENGKKLKDMPPGEIEKLFFYLWE